MNWSYRLLFGPIAALLFCFGTVMLAMMVPGYSHIRQTVSEIGEAGSPARVPFAILLCGVAACILVFATSVRHLPYATDRSPVVACAIGFMAVSAAGVGVFAYPHPLHNIFGISQLIGYQAPLVLALAWRRDPRASTVVAFSWLMFVLIWCAIALNLSTLVRDTVVWPHVRLAYGLVQRSLFATWFAWCAGVGLLLFRRNSGVDQKA